MSYVHFLDIFDPAGLPPGLSDHDAAEQARSLRLTTPSQRLLALLTRIRQQPPGITVNVVGGQDQQPVEWVAGEPPRVEGDGAHYALWTLILPVDEDYDTEELEDVAPQIEAWAKELGLRVFDEAQEAFAPPEPASPQPASAAPVHPATSGDQVVSIYLNHFIWAPYFKQGGRQLGLGLEEIGDELMLMEQFPEPGLADRCLAWRGRLIHRLMQQLPWQTHGNALWVDGDPALRHRQWGGPGFELRVPANRLDEVMRVLMPLVRQLNAHVMVPSRQFWFTFWNSVSPGAETQLNDWDPAWQTPPMKDKPRRALVIAGLKSRLEPLGFALEEGPEASYWFMRPLRPGGGYQIVRAYVGFRLQLNVTSARYLRIQQQRGGGAGESHVEWVQPGGSGGIARHGEGQHVSV